MLKPFIFSSFSQDVQDIKILESWAYHRTLIEEHPEPCLTCHNRLSEADIIASNSLFSAHLVTQAFKPRLRTGLLSWLMGKFTRS